MFTIARYGWRPDVPDQRDHLYRAKPLVALPPSIDMRGMCPPVYDQGQLGSCTANAIAGAIEFNQIKQSLPEFTPSRLFIYFNERVIEHTIHSDAGASLRDGIKTIASTGVCDEKEWPYVIRKFAKRPIPVCYTLAKTDLVTGYTRLDNTQLDQLKSCLASGFCFVFGFTVYESFESQVVASSGIVPLPASQETVLGGHACVAVGYDDATGRFTVRNSWGASWGTAGYFTIPYQYLSSSTLAADFWQISSS